MQSILNTQELNSFLCQRHSSYEFKNNRVFFKIKSSVLRKLEQKSLLKKGILKLRLCSIYNERQRRSDSVFSIWPLNNQSHFFPSLCIHHTMVGLFYIASKGLCLLELNLNRNVHTGQQVLSHCCNTGVLQDFDMSYRFES